MQTLLHPHVTWYVLPLAISFVITALLCGYGLARRSVPGGRAFALLMAGAALWSAADALAIMSENLDAYLLFARIKFVATAIVPWAWLTFARQYTGRSDQTERIRLALTGAFPAVVALLVAIPATSELVVGHGVFDSTGTLPRLELELEPLFWIYATYSYGLLLLGTTFLAGSLLRSWRFFRTQALIVLTATVVPLAVNAAYMIGFSPVRGVDTTPMAFGIAGIIFAWGFFRARFLDVAPLAHSAVFTGLADGVIVLDARDRVVDLNPAAARILNCSGSVVGQTVGAAFCEEAPVLVDVLAEPTHARELVVGPLGMQRHYEVRVSLLTRPGGDHAGRLLLLHDVTERAQTQAVLTHRAHHDDLTGLPNRAHFDLRLREVIEASRRDGTVFALLMIDLDGFKTVNDTLGHHAGDLLLRRLAERLRASLRDVDSCARMGGDEFAAIVPGAGESEASAVASRLLDAFAAPLTVEGRSVTMRASIGITISDGAYGDPATLLREVDDAMYAAKRGGYGFALSHADHTARTA